MDKTLDILIAMYPGLRWARMRTHHAGRAGALVVAVFPAGDGWCADGQLGPGRMVHHGEGADVHAALRSLAQCSPAYAQVLLVEPVRVVEYSRYPDGPPKVERPVMAPGPAALGCPALAAVFGLVGAFGAALWLGVEAVRWLTGGAS